jgi:hypothetical protein
MKNLRAQNTWGTEKLNIYDTFPITKVDIDPALLAYTFGELNDFYHSNLREPFSLRVQQLTLMPN